MSGGIMDETKTADIVFDYTTFLGVVCRRKWTFLEAIQSFAPIFGVVWKDNLSQMQTPQDRIWDQALSALSAQNSDETNLVRLVKLARAEGIEKITLIMPYELEQDQKTNIGKKSHSVITDLNEDEFLIVLEQD
ncbi:transporter [Vibrio sp. S9_S30]|nr:transporter [Vibrio sp. S9_S30]